MNLGILGGMGPMATVDFFKKIVENTDANSDQDHIHILIDNNTKIPDRTSFIKGQGENPKFELIKSIIKLDAMGADYIAIPCNTAHYFYNDIKEYTSKKIVHIVYETLNYAKENFPNTNKFLLLGTEGIYLARIYEDIFEEAAMDMLVPSEEDKKEIMKWIYGIKAGSHTTTVEGIEKLCSKYIDLESDSIILGCTELPILFQDLYGEDMRTTVIDPTMVLAKKCIELCKE